MSGNFTYYNNSFTWRTVSHGSKYHQPDVNFTSGLGDFTADGSLNQAPMGMGMLLVGGYLPDARTFYCPSSDGMPSDNNRHHHPDFRLAHWQRAGGFDAETLLYGDWHTSGAEARAFKMVQGHYNYRNIPIQAQNLWHVWEDDTYGIPFTRPRVNFRLGQPMFRTLRELNGRALASDTFTKFDMRRDGLGRDWRNTTISHVNDTRQIAGAGIAAHRTMYNVLYGDGRVSALGDPQEEIIWHTQGRDSAAFINDGGGGVYTFANTFFYGTSGMNAMWAAGGKYLHTPFAVWHRMDAHGGLDTWYLD